MRKLVGRSRVYCSADVAVITSAHRADDVRIYRKECRAFTEAGMKVLLVAPRAVVKTEQLSGLDLVEVSRPSSRLLRVLLGPILVFSVVFRSGVKAVHAHDPELLPLLFLWKLTHPRGVAIFDAHESLPRQVLDKSYLPEGSRGLVSRLSRLLITIAGKFCDGIVCATSEIEKEFGCPRSSVVVRNFPWISDFPNPVDRTNSFIGDLCYVGSVSEARGIAAMDELSKNWTVNVAGPVSEELVRRYPRPNYCGAIAGKDIPEFVGGHRLGLAIYSKLANFENGLPTKVFEYMASGRPYIVTDMPGCAALFTTEVGGLVVDTENGQALRNAVDKVVSDPDWARTLGRRSRSAFLEKFSFDREAELLLEFYRSLGVVKGVAEVVRNG